MHSDPTARNADCPLCMQDGGTVLWRNTHLRVVAVADADYPGFTRVIWNAHCAEMTDLTPPDRDQVMQAVYTVEQAMRQAFNPTKINLAAFGTMVPHLHWHIIPRWQGDRHYPDAYWAAPRIAPGTEPQGWTETLEHHAAALPAYTQVLCALLDDCFPND